MRPHLRRVDWPRVWFIASCTVLVFAYGVAVGRYQLFPFRVLNLAVYSLLQVKAEARMLLGVRPDWHLGPAEYEGDGVTVVIPDRMAPGPTLISGMIDGENELRLIDQDGTPIRTWEVHFTELFDPTDDPESARLPQRDWNAQIHGALALPDGSVVFNFDYAGTVKLDRCGEVQWLLPEATHHSIEPSRDGGFWIPGRRYTDVVAGFPRTDSEYEEDLILKVSGDGEILKSIPTAELFVENDLPHLLLFKGPGSVFRPGELVHLNDIEELPDSIADRFPQFEAGDLLLSFRNLFLLMVVDPETRGIKWHQIGPWIHQHDPDFQPDGTITIFDNRNDDRHDGGHLGGSTILSLDPTTGETRVLYGGVPGQEMHTSLLGKHQMLPNANLLITQALSGRILEATPEGELVWELINRHDENQIAFLTQANRYPPSYFDVQDWTCPE